MDKENNKEQSVSAQLVALHWKQYINFADETADALADKEKLTRLAERHLGELL